MTRPPAPAQAVGGRYRLHSLIGRGGAGAVWRGDDLQLHRPVAIKQILLSEQRSTRCRARAVREAQAVARLQAPGVVQLYDLFEDGPYAYLVMELVDAPSLSRLVRREGPLAPAAAAAACRSLAATLAAIHRAGVVHRDVKPSNVLVDGPDLRLTDFGIALLGDDPTLTASGSVLGTPAYMAPEQAHGRRPGPSADLYGLGATLYFAIEGRAPFADVGALETTVAVREQPHRPGTRLGPLAPIIDALLAKEPCARPCAEQVDVALARAAGDLSPTRLPRGDAPSTQTPTTSAPAPAGAAEGTAEPAQPDADATRHHPTEPPDTTADTTGDDRRTAHDVLVRVVGLLGLLALALVLLFLAVREQPATGAAPDPTPRSVAADQPVAADGAATYHGSPAPTR